MAGNRIKGITVQIGGDTTGLNKALQGVNKEIKSTQTQLKDVNKLLKLDPGNTELLSQKHKLLGESVASTKEKLQTLKTAAEQANEALAKGDISQAQYDALQREIIDTEQELSKLESQANQSAVAVQKIGLAGENLKTLGNNISGVGTKLLPVTAAVTALGTAAIKTTADFDAAMSQVAAVSGATGDDLQQLRDKAREMGSKTKFSASEAAEAMNYMAMAGWKTSEMLGGIEGIMSLAAASGEELGTTSDIVTDALTAFGLTASDSGHFADVLAAASSNANTNVSMMGETFKYAAPIAGALGFSVEDTAEAIGLMANAGIKGSQAGTSLRTIMNNLSSDIELCGDSLGQVTIKTTNADGSMRDLADILTDCRGAFSQLSESEQAASAEALVGKNAMSGFLALMNAGEGDVNKLRGAIAGCDGTAAQMAETMQDNLSGQATILKSQLEELAISFGELLMPAIRTIVGWIQSFVDTLNSMDDGTRKVVMTVGLLAAALGPVLIIVGKVITAVGTIMTIVPKVAGVINAVKGAFAGLNVVMSANPIGVIVVAIAALVAAFIYLWNNCEGFRQFWIDLWEGLKQIVMVAWEAIKSFIMAAWEAIKNVAITVWTAISTAISTIIDTIHTVITTVWTAIQTAVTTVVTAIQNTITAIWTGIRDTVTAMVDTIKNAVTGAFTAMWNGITSTITGIYNTVVEGFNRAVGFVTGLASQAFTWGRDLIMGIVDGIKSAVGAVVDAVSSVADTIFGWLHFSTPDIGPLVDYESWMPDFMNGLAKGIEKSRGLVQKAVSDVSSDLLLNPKVGDVGLQDAKSASDGNLVRHTGTIRVEGVNDAGTLSGVVDVVIDRLRQEVRT